ARPGRRPQMRALMEDHRNGGGRSRLSGRHAARRPGAARMGKSAQGGGVAVLVGPLTRFGFAVAAVTCVLDQAAKLWLLRGFGLEARGVVPVAPMVDLVLTRNTGISYGLFQHDSAAARWLLLGISVLAVLLLGMWLARTNTRLTALALGLIIGGAAGNAIDRLAYGWV